MRKDAIYNLSDDEFILAKTKNTDKNRLGFAILLKYFQLESRLISPRKNGHSTKRPFVLQNRQDLGSQV